MNADDRQQRLAQLRRELAALNARVRATAVGSPQREALLVPMEPLFKTVLALAQELEALSPMQLLAQRNGLDHGR